MGERPVSPTQQVVDALRLAKERAVEAGNDADLAIFRDAEKSAMMLRAQYERQRAATGRAWGAFLDTITPEMWEDIRALYPETFRRLQQALSGS